MQENTLINNKMKPTFELHKLKEGFIVTSDEVPEIKKDWALDETNKLVNLWFYPEKIKGKLIVQQDQIDFSGLSEEEQKKIGWFDVEKLAELETITNEFNSEKSFITGFQKAQELLSDRRFTLEDIRRAWKEGYNERNLDEYIQSLSQKSWSVEIEMEEMCKHDCMKFQLNGINSTCCGEKILTSKLTNGKIKIIKLL
jgi:hypothetical protein